MSADRPRDRRKSAQLLQKCELPRGYAGEKRALTHQERAMAGSARLPRRLPVGTRYVLEGVPAGPGQVRVISRLILLPNGQQFDLTHEMPEADRPQRSRRSKARRRIEGPSGRR